MAYTSAYTGAEIDEGITRASSHAARHAIGGEDELTPSAIGAVQLDSNGCASPDQTASRIVNVTASKTLALTDSGTFQWCTNSSDITITIPSNVAFPVKTEIEIARTGSGNVTIAAAAGITLISANSLKSIVPQNASAGLKKLDASTWFLNGSLG